MKKRLLSFLLLFALVGTSFIACKDDPIVPETPEEPEGTTPSVQFGDYGWPAIQVKGNNPGTDGYVGMVLTQDGSTVNYPNIYVYWYGSGTGTTEDYYDKDRHTFANDRILCLEYYEEHPLVDGEGYYYGDWWADSASITITQFNAEGMKVDIDARMFSAAQAYSYQMGYEAADRRQLTLRNIEVGFDQAKQLMDNIARINGHR